MGETNNREKISYIYSKFSTTKIDKVYWPIIAEIILRRQYQFGLNYFYFKRDVDTFVKNVNKIEIKKIKGNNIGAYDIIKRSIIIDSSLFESEVNFENIFEILTHECTHAMNFTRNKNSIIKNDRAFGKDIHERISKIGIMEAFTQEETDFLVLNEGGRHSYQLITPYVNVIALAFGVKKNDLLKCAVKSRDNLNNTLNSSVYKNSSFQLSNEDNRIFERIALNVELMRSALVHYRKGNNRQKSISIENVKKANSEIYKAAEDAIIMRIKNLDPTNFNLFRKEFELIVVHQELVKGYIEGNFQGIYEKDSDIEELRESTNGRYKMVDIKLKCINAILNNDRIVNKEELLESIQDTFNFETVYEIINNNQIEVDFDKNIQIPSEKKEKYDSDFLANIIPWDNTRVIQYFKEHQKEITPKENRLFIKIKNWFSKNIIGLNSSNMQPLPAGKPQKESENKHKSWELTNSISDNCNVANTVDSNNIFRENKLNEDDVNEK